MKFLLILLIQIFSITYTFSQEDHNQIFKTTNSSIRNIEFFYVVKDSINDINENTWSWSACIQIQYKENDSISDQILLVNEIVDSPFSNPMKLDAKLIQALNNISDSFKKGVLEINYNKIQSLNNSLLFQTTSAIEAESKIRSAKELYSIKIYYFKKESNNQDNVIVLTDRIILRLIWHQEPVLREYLILNPKNNITNQVKVLIL